jgi:hypothetical protein
MKLITVLASAVMLVGCTSAPTITPTPLPTNTPTPASVKTAERTIDYVPPDIPTCSGLQALERALVFDWPGIDDVGEADWLYYRCVQGRDDLAAIYRGKMTSPPYSWVENAWVELPQGKLGVYLHTDSVNWLYLWFIADSSSPANSYLVVARRNETPLDLPCH